MPSILNVLWCINCIVHSGLEIEKQCNKYCVYKWLHDYSQILKFSLKASPFQTNSKDVDLRQ